MLATVLNSIETDAVRCISGRLSDLELGQLESTPRSLKSKHRHFEILDRTFGKYRCD